jgi:DNA ligase (NAD+)
VEVLDVKGVGEVILQNMCRSGLVKTPADLFTLTYEQYAQLDRVGEKHYQKLRAGLTARSEVSVPLFFASLDIEGPGTWENICRVAGLQTFEQIMFAVERCPELFSKAVRVSLDKAVEIVREIKTKWDDIQALAKHVRFKVQGTNLLGKVFVITGTLSKPRSEIESLIKQAGGSVSSSVTTKTSYLVCDAGDSNSTKSRRARELRVPIIDESKLMEFLL